MAVGLFNRGQEAAAVTVQWADVPLPSMPSVSSVPPVPLVPNVPHRARDLWTHTDVELNGASYSAIVPPHGVVMLRVAQ